MEATLAGLTFLLFIILVLIFGIGVSFLRFYGIYLSFKKKWYFGVISLIVPCFAEVVALFKLIGKKDILK